MSTYFLRRLLLVIPNLLLVTVMIFALVRFLPGDTLTVMLGEYGYGGDLESLRQKLGISQPIHEQYLSWLGRAVRGDLGESLWTKRGAVEEMMHRIPVSLELGLLAMLVSLLISVPIGVLAAVRQDTWADYISRTAAIGFLSAPIFWLGIMVVVLPSVWFGWTPPLRFTPFTKDPLANLAQFAIPAFILGAHSTGTVLHMTRAMMLEVLRQDYVRTAWAKGLREQTVIYRHALKNAVIPVVTVIGLQIPTFIGGSVIIEQIFGLPGAGQFLVEVLGKRDYTMVQSLNLFFALIVLGSNLAVDISYGWLDPRIRYN